MILSLNEFQFSLLNIENYWTLFLIWIINTDLNFPKPMKLQQNDTRNYSHGCLIDFPDSLSPNNPINHTETKAKEVNPKKIST